MLSPPALAFKQLKDRLWLMTRCSAIGTGIGAIPGTGGPIAAFLAYAHAKKSSKNPERFGRGEMAGVVGPMALTLSKPGL